MRDLPEHLRADAVGFPTTEDGFPEASDAQRTAEAHARLATAELNRVGGDTALAHAHAATSLAWSSVAFNRSRLGGAL